MTYNITTNQVREALAVDPSYARIFLLDIRIAVLILKPAFRRFSVFLERVSLWRYILYLVSAYNVSFGEEKCTSPLTTHFEGSDEMDQRLQPPINVPTKRISTMANHRKLINPHSRSRPSHTHPHNSISQRVSLLVHRASSSRVPPRLLHGADPLQSLQHWDVLRYAPSLLLLTSTAESPPCLGVEVIQIQLALDAASQPEPLVATVRVHLLHAAGQASWTPANSLPA